MTDSERLEEARRALEGAERTEKRQQTEHAQALKVEFEEIEKQLAEIQQQKEKLELAWVDLDNQKKAIRVVLNPLLDEEKKWETSEAQLETEEASTGVPASRHEVEVKRWQTQEQRKNAEQKKWTEEEKVIAIDKIIEENTKQYRQLLTAEDKLVARLEQLKTQTPV